jgi:NAD(P)-dependent dehydrogenase (short-subunit alcohol dehydrogenase family)
MTNLVITGSTRGIGFTLAQAFLERDCAVMINGRTTAGVQSAVAALVERVGTKSVAGHVADMTVYDQVVSLWDVARERFGRVDVWINNAGLGHRPAPAWDQAPGVVRTVVETNLLGSMYGSMVALSGMLDQGGGAIYNVEGMGSDGRRHDGLIVYGTTKYGLHYFNQALAEEARGTPVVVGWLRPGMVLTDLVVGQYRGRPDDWARAKSIFNIIADHAETVAPWLADRVLDNKRNGAEIAWLSRPKLMLRFLTAPFVRRHVVDGIDPEADHRSDHGSDHDR